MSRSRGLWTAPAALALLAVGCAHCDRCDDFPVPSPTVAYDGSYTPVIPEGQAFAGSMTTTPTAPPAAAIPGPFNATPPSGSDRVSPPPASGNSNVIDPALRGGTPDPVSGTPASQPTEPPLPSGLAPLGEPPTSPPLPDANGGGSR